MKKKCKHKSPYRVGDHLEVTVSDMTRRGEGVGHVQGQALFVEDAVVGEKVETRLTAVKSQYLKGDLVRIIAPSAHRDTPKCAAFPACGGCQWLNLKPESENQLKRNIVIQAFAHIGGLQDAEAKVRPTVGMADPKRYRNKAQLKVSEQGIGFYRKGSHDVIPIDDCMNQADAFSEIIAACRKWMAALHLRVYDEKRRKGTVRGFLVRTNRAGDIMLVLICAKPLSAAQKAKTVEIFKSLSGLKSLMFSLHDKPNNRVLGESAERLAGADYIEERLCGCRFHISPHSFFQVNTEQTEKLYALARQYAGLTQNETLWDLYCGTGTIGITMAKDAKRVLGVEIVPEAVADARRNAEVNGIDNITFICGKAEAVMPEEIKKGRRADVAVVDPPRKGCAKTLLDSLIASQVPKIVYVSCDPATLARDAGILTQAGYTLIEATPVNMFPGTGHVETVSLFVRT
ncbi:MAG: 23S rRNA (uracil(1939)-C(5))-methyltransferase RlmD [Pseudoramibacter sp.]